MSARQVDSYLRDLEEPNRTTLQELRRTVGVVSGEYRDRT